MRLIIFILFCFPAIANAQWNTNGSHIYYNSGYVGIGTTNPQYPLDVLGDIKVSHALYSNQGTDALGAVHWRLTSGNIFRIGLGLINSENGSNSGSNFSIWRYADNGGFLESSFFLRRADGNVGLGTEYPETRLHVNGDSRFNGTGWFGRNNNGNASVSLRIGQNQGWDYPAVEISTVDNGGSSSSSWFGTRWAHTMTFQRASSVGTKNIVAIIGNDGEQALQVYSVDGNTGKIKLNADGISYIQNSLAIGTTDPLSYKLAVNGDAIFNKVKVKQYPWSDYVFYPNYRLPSLKEVEEFIKQYKHLPDIPSEEEVQQNGLDVGDNQALLLKKIEELTLYIIEQDKKIQEQNTKIEYLENQNKELRDIKKDLENLKTIIQNKN